MAPLTGQEDLLDEKVRKNSYVMEYIKDKIFDPNVIKHIKEKFFDRIQSEVDNGSYMKNNYELFLTKTLASNSHYDSCTIKGIEKRLTKPAVEKEPAQIVEPQVQSAVQDEAVQEKAAPVVEPAVQSAVAKEPAQVVKPQV